MRINAKMLRNVSGLNHWEYASEAFLQEGQINEFYLQLVDLNKIQPAEKSKSQPDFPLRYITQAAVASLVVTFPALDSGDQFDIVATQPFADDKSIWKVTIPSTQTPSSGNITVSFTEDGVQKTFVVRNAIRVELLNVGGC